MKKTRKNIKIKNRTIRKKQESAKHFIKIYLAARQGLIKLEILQSEKTLQGDYGEWLAAELLGLKPARSKNQCGWDAIDSNGRTYQIKSRIVKIQVRTLHLILLWQIIALIIWFAYSFHLILNYWELFMFLMMW